MRQFYLPYRSAGGAADCEVEERQHDERGDLRHLGGQVKNGGYVVVDSAVCSGKPTIRGTRIMVKNILGLVAGGYSADRILET